MIFLWDWLHSIDRGGELWRWQDAKTESRRLWRRFCNGSIREITGRFPKARRIKISKSEIVRRLHEERLSRSDIATESRRIFRNRKTREVARRWLETKRRCRDSRTESNSLRMRFESSIDREGAWRRCGDVETESSILWRRFCNGSIREITGRRFEIGRKRYRNLRIKLREARRRSGGFEIESNSLRKWFDNRSREIVVRLSKTRRIRR